MKKIFILTFLVALTGCMSTPNEVRNKSPVYEVDSNKSPEVLAKCIYDGWTNTRTLLERDNTTHVEKWSDVITVFSWHDIIFADVVSSPNGSIAKMYKTTGGAYALEANRRDVVSSCK